MKRAATKQKTTVAKKRKVVGTFADQRGPGAVNLARKPGFNPEMKAVDSGSLLVLDNTGAAANHVGLLNGLLLNTDRFNRIGRRINVKKLSIKCFIFSSAAAPAVIDDVFRIAVVWDEQPNGVLPTLADLWSDTNNVGAITSNVMSFNNLNNASRFKILRTHSIPINAETQALESPAKKVYWEWNIPMNHIVQYNAGNAGTLADIATGAIYIVAHGLNSPAPTVWSLQWTSRCKYTD